MGFLSKIRKGMKKQVDQMPRRGGGFLGKIRNKAFDRIESGKIPARSGFLRGQYFGPRGNMGSNFRKPILGVPAERTIEGIPISQLPFNPRMPGKIFPFPKRPIKDPIKGGFGNLRNLIRRLKEQRDMGMPRMEGSIGRLPGIGMIGTPQPISDRMPSTDDGRMYAGGSPGLYKPGGRFYNPGARLKMPQPIPRAEIDISALERLPMGDMPMAQDLPEVAPIGMMPQMRMGGMQDMEPRMMMQAGEDVSLERELFSLQSQLENLKEQLRMDRSYNDDQAVINTSAEMAAIQRRIQEILQESGQTISREDSQMGFKAAGSIGLDDQGNPVFPGYAEGGEADSNDFPDLSGDGQITRKDILIGQGVKFKAEGGEMMMEGNEINAMLGGMDSEEAGAMEDLEQMAPEMEMIDQLVTMVVQMIQQGASEEEVIMFLREQGLDDEDIGTVLQLVAEMAEAEAMPQDGIGAELEQLV
jgi:hypothetical protein